MRPGHDSRSRPQYGLFTISVRDWVPPTEPQFFLRTVRMESNSHSADALSPSIDQEFVCEDPDGRAIQSRDDEMQDEFGGVLRRAYRGPPVRGARTPSSVWLVSWRLQSAASAPRPPARTTWASCRARPTDT